LWSFNEEIVARAIAVCTIPIISGVGHETDFTIADFAADVRASTPSAAAELVVQTRREFDKHINELRENLASLIRYRLSHSSRRVHELSARRAFRRPLDILRQQRQRSDEMTSRLALGLRARLEQSRKRFNVTHLRIVAFDFHKQIVRLRNRTSDFAARIELGLRARLAQSRRRHAAEHLRLVSFDFRCRVSTLRLLLERRHADLAKRSERVLRAKRERLERLRLQLEERSPLRVLERGYAIATDASGNVLRDAAQVTAGATVNVQLHRGRLLTEVKSAESEGKK
jgi:exodeoxyribonuclease VII large subunit